MCTPILQLELNDETRRILISHGSAPSGTTFDEEREKLICRKEVKRSPGDPVRITLMVAVLLLVIDGMTVVARW
jgi:hypothetical protein